MTFEQQYERMIKRQLGGLLQCYIDHQRGAPDRGDPEVSKKQRANMAKACEEFERRFGKTVGVVRSVEEMQAECQGFPHDSGQDPPVKEQKLCEMDCVAVGVPSQGLEVVGTSSGIYMNTRVKQEVGPECTFRIDACPEADHDQSSSNEECESLVVDAVVSYPND